MPEMPEVQAHAERLTHALAGSVLQSFQVLNFAGLKTFDPPADAAVGATLVDVTRRGKYIVMNFDNDIHHVIHLMQGGRLRFDAKQSKRPRNGIVRWVFSTSDGPEAWLLTEAGTERKAGVWAVRGNPLDQPPLSDLGPEADQLSSQDLRLMFAGQSKRVHGLLRDQRVVAGLGRMLTNEILFEASLSPFAQASKLTESDLDRLADAIGSSTASGLDHERTLSDIGKSVDRPSKVHNRAGQPCLDADCDDTVQVVEYRRYTVYYCPTRQTGGKKLADNTTSKFLK